MKSTLAVYKIYSGCSAPECSNLGTQSRSPKKGGINRQENLFPYNWSSSDNQLADLADGSYTLKAVAEDTTGKTAQVSISVTIENDNNNDGTPDNIAIEHYLDNGLLIRKELDERLDKIVEETGETKSYLVEQLLEFAIGAYEKEKLSKKSSQK